MRYLARRVAEPRAHRATPERVSTPNAGDERIQEKDAIRRSPMLIDVNQETAPV